MTLRNGTSSDKTFESDFQAVNETHRPTEIRGGHRKIDRYEESGEVTGIWSAPATSRTSRT